MQGSEWLREQMDRRSLSVRDVADATGIRATQAIYNWLSGKSAPSDDAAAKLADLLDVPEIEVRRRFGLWVPDDAAEPEPQREESELERIDRLLRTAYEALAEAEQLRRNQEIDEERRRTK